MGAMGNHPNSLGGMEVGDYTLWQTFANANPGAWLQQWCPVFK